MVLTNQNLTDVVLCTNKVITTGNSLLFEKKLVPEHGHHFIPDRVGIEIQR
ncbi:unnamed protein product [Gongylonema pulchrum]|uniref:PTS EIIA type-1 domain-containing protein n=1 Tax=Gongylonema pulchrum TaxID=637853 RepID=A0A183DZK3_9BILA|nr:unnamed protein product [Gongylonema pulchrum]